MVGAEAAVSDSDVGRDDDEAGSKAEYDFQEASADDNVGDGSVTLKTLTTLRSLSESRRL